MLQEFAAERRPREKLGVGVSVCFMCSDALAVHRRAQSSGLAPREPFVGNRLWVAELVDPTATASRSRARPMFRRTRRCRKAGPKELAIASSLSRGRMLLFQGGRRALLLVSPPVLFGERW